MDSILIAEQRSENSEFQKGVDFFSIQTIVHI